jgi:hypothetical protein
MITTLNSRSFLSMESKRLWRYNKQSLVNNWKISSPKLINMNHNNYPSSWESLCQNCWWTKLRMNIQPKNKVGQHAPKILPRSLSLILCGIVWCIWTQGKHTQSTLLVVKASIWGVLGVLEFFVKGEPKWPITSTSR